jgi:hypothetical protein
MKSFQSAFVVLLVCALLATSGCFSYHSDKKVVEPSTEIPSETTTTTTTHSDDGTTQQRSTTTTNPYPK